MKCDICECDMDEQYWKNVCFTSNPEDYNWACHECIQDYGFQMSGRGKGNGFIKDFTPFNEYIVAKRATRSPIVVSPDQVCPGCKLPAPHVAEPFTCVGCKAMMELQ